MTADGHGTSTHTHDRPRGDRRRHLLPALAGAALATALLAGCGAGDSEAPGEETGTDGSEQTSATEDSTDPTTAPEEETPADGGGSEGDSDGGSDEGSSGEGGSDESDSDAGGSDGDAPGGENLFEGSWNFGHDEKVLEAEELASLLEAEAESRGPEEMSLEVECEDGVDTGVPDYTAECTAYADEGVEHAWLITVGPADAGLVIEVENTD